MRRLRIILAVLGTIAALVVAAALAAPYAVDTARARQAVSTWMSGLLGREVQIQGTMRFTLLPILGFVIEDFSVAGPEGEIREPLARIDQAAIAVAPWPLLQRQVVVERIHLQRPQIHLVRDADGRANWAGLSVLSRDASGRAEKTAALMQFEQVTVSDGSLHLQDTLAGREVVVSGIAFRRRGKGSRTFTVGARALWHQSPVPGLEQLTAALRLTGAAVVDPGKDRYAIENADLRLTLQPRETAHKSPSAVLEAVASADAATRFAKLERLRITVPGAHLDGSASGRIEAEEPRLDARLKVNIEAFQEFLAAFDIEVPSAAGYHLPRAAALEMKLSARPGRLAFDDMQGTVDRIPVAGSLSMDLDQPFSWQATLRTGELDLNAYLPADPGRTGRNTAPRMPVRNLDLSLEAEALLWKHHRLERTALRMHGRPDGGIEVKTATGRLAGGDWRLEGSFQPRQQGWAGRLALSARNAAVTQLWPPGTPSPFVRGRVDLDADLTADDFDPKHFLRNAEGRVTLSTRRPLQAAEGLQTKIQGRLTTVFGRDHHLVLDGDINSREPDFTLDFKSEGTWDLHALVLDGDQTSLTVSSPALPGPGGRLHLDGDLSLSLPRRKATWRQTRISLPEMGVTAEGNLDLARGDGASVIDASVDILPMAPRPFLAKSGWALPELADAAALEQMSASVRFHFDGRELVVRDLDLKLDDSRVRGTVDIAAFKPLRARFNLAADRVDLDRYLPRGDGAGNDDHSRDEGPMDIQGALAIGQLTLFDLDAVAVSARVTADRRTLRFDPVYLTLYEGATTGMFEVSLDDSDPVWRTRAVVNGTQLRRPLETLFGRPVLSGKSDIAADLHQRRDKSSPTVAKLNGKLNFTVRNGRVHGVRIVSDAGEVGRQTGSSGGAIADGEPFQPFDFLEGSWTLTDGVAASEDHRLRAVGLQMAAAGRVDFVQDALDATLSVDIPALPPVYYALKGPFDDISVEMDRARLVFDSTTGIFISPLKLGQGTLGKGAEMLERGGEAIGDDSGVQQLGQGAMTAGKGMLEVGKGVLELHRGGESFGEGAKSVGEGVAGMGKGVVGMGKDAINTGLEALEGFGRGLERLLGGGGEKAASEESGEGQPGTE
jgi:uncharacterized protein involved in outer membrane biogenesis